ncbi:MFS general substrate transporter [Linnemannia elongata AG-77]|uniref:MFS general substrate transporter n=1 Tax=Linnemannia elongata AG-77 TaxID=1314771 RepID=A0A197KBC0_9FUNG|nr:MFS general substrate transporter [Linnemannia elongata AG-77]
MTDQHTEAAERQPLIDPRDRYRRIPRSQDEENGHAAVNSHNATPQEQGGDESNRLAAIQALPWYRRPSIGWLLPFVFLAVLVMGISQAPQEQLIIQIICKEHFKEREPRSEGGVMMTALLGPNGVPEDPCGTQEVLGLAAVVLGRVRALKYTSGMFTIGFITSLSDKYGRKALIYLTLLPAALTQLLILYMARPTSNLGVGVLYADGIFMGVVGAGILLEPCLNAYIADCTPRLGRSVSIGYVMVALSVGMMVGPLIPSYLKDSSTAMLVSACTLCFLMIYSLFMPESLPKHLRAKSVVDGDGTALSVPASTSSPVTILTKRYSSPLVRMKDWMVTVVKPVLLFLPGRIELTPDVNVPPSPYMLLVLLAGYGILQFATNGITIILIPYTNLAFRWKVKEDGYYLALNGASTFIVYVGIFPLLQKLYARVYDTKKASKVDTLTDDHPAYSADNNSSSTAPAKATTKRATGNDLTFFIFGSAVYAVAYLLVPLFETEAALYLSCALRALASVALPSFTSLLTSHIPTHQTGKALGGVAVVDTMVMSLSALLYGWVFSKTSNSMPSAVFLLSSVCTCLSVFAGLIVWVMFKRAERRQL